MSDRGAEMARIRECIAAQQCPWCERGGFQLLARHTHAAHGITAEQIREMAGLLKSDPICAPEHSAACAERPQMGTPPTYRGGSGITYSSAGREAAKESGRRLSERFPPAMNPRMAQRKARGNCLICSGPLPASKPVARVTCSPKCRRIRRAQVARETKPVPRPPCAVCGGPIPFVPGRTNVKTCSEPCRATLRSRAATDRNLKRAAQRDTPA